VFSSECVLCQEVEEHEAKNSMHFSERLCAGEEAVEGLRLKV
jgi:hypothetical protein